MLSALVHSMGLVLSLAGPAAAPAAVAVRPRAEARAAHRRPAAPPARASSVARAAGGARHDPALVLDGDSSTAWCEGAPGAGIGEWIELRPSCPRGKGICSVAVESGWSKSPETWARHGRVTRLRLAPCTLDGDGTAVDLKDVPERQEFVLRTPLPAPACVRLTILGARTGEDPITCISEVVASCECER